MTKTKDCTTPTTSHPDNKARGSYVLLIELPEVQTVTVGRRKAIRFLPGYYAYVGSALGGFKSRLNHHLKGSQRPRWHIDYLLPLASISSIILFETRDRVECTIAQTLSRRFDSIPGFGTSDCKCHSHIFFTTEARQMKSAVMANIDHLDIRPRLVEPVYPGCGEVRT